jgi:xanthine dehydrogenase accessory factor
MYDEFFSKAHELKSQGIPFATAMVIHADKPTSAKTGDKAIITADGTLYGWIGGSCAQPTVIKEAAKALSEGKSRYIRLSPDPSARPPHEDWIELPMTCFSGGTLEIYIEPQHAQPRLLIMGSTAIAQSLAHLGKVMNYEVIAFDPDGGEVEHADRTLADLDEAAELIRTETFVVIATHGNFDEPAIEAVARSNPLYIGLVASRKRHEAVVDYLRRQGLTDDDLAVLKAPAGLDIQARGGNEIALSIMAEIVQRRRNRQQAFDLSAMQPDQADTDPHEHGHEHKHGHAHQAEPEIAIDPICGMEVEIATAQFTHEYEGQMYYFCCAGCETTFAANPEEYVTAAPPAGQAIDPICHMTVDIATAKFMSEYEGQFFYFCSAGCKTTFDEQPELYAAAVKT